MKPREVHTFYYQGERLRARIRVSVFSRSSKLEWDIPKKLYDTFANDSLDTWDEGFDYFEGSVMDFIPLDHSINESWSCGAKCKHEAIVG